MIHQPAGKHAEQQTEAAPLAQQEQRQDTQAEIGHDAEQPQAQSFAPMQQHALGKTVGRDDRRLAAQVKTSASPLPFRAELERSFGEPLAGVRAHLGERELLEGLGGEAAADGEVIAFRDAAPSRETVAHEVAHVVQARSGRGGGGAGAEVEARDVEARVAAGEPVGELQQGASGLHMKDQVEIVDARRFIREMLSVSDIAYSALAHNRCLELHPYATYLGTPQKLLEELFYWGGEATSLTKPFHDKIERFIAPEPLVPLVNNARKADTPVGGTVAGPMHYVFMDSVGLALGNALTRSLRQSVTRMLPRYVAASQPERCEDGTVVATAKPSPISLAVSHPLDTVVAFGLCANGVTIDAGKFAKAHPDMIAEEQKRQTGEVKIKFAWERNLWHWVEAPEGASAEQVAKALFGEESAAYRLTPMAPLFGFRGSDVEVFKQEKRDELNELAKKHHPNPAVLNWLDIASYDQKKAEEAIPGDYDGYGSGDSMDGGVPPPARLPDPPSTGPDPNRPKEEHGFPADHDVDPAVELAAEMGDSYARRRTLGTADGKQHDEKSVYDKLDDCLDNLSTAHAAFTTLALSTDGIEKFTAKFKRRQQKTLDACLADPNGEFALAEQQALVLKRLAKGATETTSYLSLFGGVSKSDATVPSPYELPEAAREPIEEAANAYAAALDVLPLPEIALPRLDKADGLQKTLRITILENSIYRAEPTIYQAIETPGDRHANGVDYDPREKLSNNNSLLHELSMLRVEMEADPATTEKKLGNTQTRAGDHLFEISVIANFEALDNAWKLVNDEHGFWEDLDDAMRGMGLESKNRGFYNEFAAIYRQFEKAVKAQSEPDKQLARDAFKDLVDRKDFQNHFETIKDHLADVANSKKWNKIIAGIAIAVVAMALGQVYFGALLAETGSVVLASLGGAAVETTTNVVLSKLVFDADPTAGNLITGFVGSAVMYGVLGRALMAGRAAGVGAELGEEAIKVSGAMKAGTWVANTSKELLFAQALGLVQAQIAAMIDGTELTEQQIKEMLIHNVAGLVGMKIGQRMIDHSIDPLKPFKQLGAKNGIDVKGLLTEKTELERLARDVADTKDPALAQELIDRERAYLQRERDVRDRLIEYAQRHPERMSAKQLRELEAMPDLNADAEINQARALMSLEEAGPNFYRADSRGFDVLVEMHQKSNDRLVAVETDPTTGLRTMRFETPEGIQIRIKEKMPDVGERTGPPIPVGEALDFERWIDNEALMHVGNEGVDQLRRLYATDPRAAIALGQKYGYNTPLILGGDAPLQTHAAPGIDHPATRFDRSDPERAYDNYASDRAGQKVQPGEPPPMDRSVFDAMYKAGYEWDPLAKSWVAGEKLPPTIDPPTRDFDRIRNGPEGVIRDEAQLNNADVAFAMNDQLQAVKPSEISQIISTFTPDQQAKARIVLAKASGYGNMESLNGLRAAMEPHLGAGLKLYTPGHGSLGDNVAYLASSRKHTFPSHPDAIDTTKTIIPGKTLVVVDDVLLHKIKTEPGFAQSLIDANAFLLEPRGFNSGLNMYNAMSPDVVAQRTSQLLDRANDIQATSNGKMNFDQAVNRALDEVTQQALAAAHPDLGGNVKAVDAVLHPDVSDAAIAGQLNGKGGITEAQVDAVMSTVPEKYRGMLRELMARQAQVFSPRSQSNEIVAGHQRVLGIAAAKGIDPGNIYYYIPKPNKSYGILAMAHREATGTSVDRYINGPSELTKVGPGRDKLVVVLDDVAGSGQSLQFATETTSNPKSENARAAGFEGEIVVVPIRSTEIANERFTGAGGFAEKDPHLTYAPNEVTKALKESDFYLKLDDIKRKQLERLLDDLGYDDNGLSMAFPYMAPDNNNMFFGDQIAKFFIMNEARDASKAPKDWKAPQ